MSDRTLSSQECEVASTRHRGRCRVGSPAERGRRRRGFRYFAWRADRSAAGDDGSLGGLRSGVADGERPAGRGLPPPLPDPAADHGDGAVALRRADVEEKQRRIAALLDATGHDAVVLGRADSLAWFTSGGDLGQCLGSEAGSVLLFINRTSRAVVTDNVQSARVFEEELAGLGFQLKERPWFDDPSRIVVELGHNKRVISDLGQCSCSKPWPRDPDPLRALRSPLTSLERQRLRELGRTLALAVEATCRNFDRGETEADVAGHLAHRLVPRGRGTGRPPRGRRRPPRPLPPAHASRPHRSASARRSPSPAGATDSAPR